MLSVYDYERLPETGPRYQLVEGELHLAPAPNRFHQTIAGNIYHALRGFLRKNPIGKAYTAPFDVRLTDLNVYQPDVCFFSVSRYGYLTEAGAKGAPDLVIEVLSPATDFLDLGAKKAIYARTGVIEMWVVEPETRVLKIFRLRENVDVPAAALGVADTLLSPVLPDLSLAVSEVFAD